MKGEIRCLSNKDQGSTFEFTCHAKIPIPDPSFRDDENETSKSLRYMIISKSAWLFESITNILVGAECILTRNLDQVEFFLKAMDNPCHAVLLDVPSFTQTQIVEFVVRLRVLLLKHGSTRLLICQDLLADDEAFRQLFDGLNYVKITKPVRSISSCSPRLQEISHSVIPDMATEAYICHCRRPETALIREPTAQHGTVRPRL